MCIYKANVRSITQFLQKIFTALYIINRKRKYIFFFIKDYVVSGDVYAGNTDERWKVENLLTWSIPEVFPQPGMNGNYWLAPSGMQGEFVLRFDQSRTVDTITIVNMHNLNERGTNEFKVPKVLISILCKYILHDT